MGTDRSKKKEVKKKSKSKSKKETILVFSAHTDDFVIGAGGTIREYTKEGKKIIAVVFSLGEKSHVWLKDKVIKDLRKEETIDSAKLLDCNLVFLDLKDQNIYPEYKEQKVEKKLLKLIEKEKPTKIFTHSGEDPHPDHRTINKITLEIYEKLNKKRKKPEIYIYSVWNPVSFNTQHPALYVNITKTFGIKLKALKMFKSQQIHVAYPTVLLIHRAITEGFKVKGKFAEKFFRIR